MVVWFLNNFNLQLQLTADSSQSILSRLGMLLAPIFQPLGYGYWQIAVALLTGLMAKEAVVSTLSVLLAGGTAVDIALSTMLTPPAAYALLVFVLLYTPCVATLAALRRESGKWGFVARSFVYQMALAWFVSWIIYRIGLLFFS